MDGFFVDFNNSVMSAVNKLSDAYQTKLANDIITLASVSITLYVLWKGYQVLAGKTQTPVQDLVWELSKFAIILMFISNANGLLTQAMEAIEDTKTALSGGGSIWKLLDDLWDSTKFLAEVLYAKDDDYVRLSGAMGKLIVWTGSTILMFCSALVFVTADVLLKLLMITSPLFIFCLMFGFLRSMFNNWLQAIFSSLITVLLASLVINISMDYQKSIVEQITSSAPDSNIVEAAVMVLVASLLGALLVYISSKIAGALAGASVEGALQGAAMMGMSNMGGMSLKGFKATGKTAFGAGRGMKDSKRTGDDIKGLNERASFSTKAGYVAGHALGKAGSKMGDLRKSILERKRAGG